MLPELQLAAVTVFTYRKRYCTPNCPYFKIVAPDLSRSGIAHCRFFDKTLLWDNRVKLSQYGYPRLQECHRAEARSQLIAEGMNHVALVGNLSEGYVAFGPYKDFSEAATNHPGPDVWIVGMVEPHPKRRAKLLNRLKRYDTQDVDGVIHELVSQGASDVNNEGIDGQFEYMEKHCGLDWIDERFPKKGK